MPKQTLSERLLSQAGEPHPQEWCMVPVNREDLREAARLCERFEQPEVADLRTKADRLDQIADEFGVRRMHGQCQKANDAASELRAHAHALVELAEAREKLGRVEAAVTGLREDAFEFTMAGKTEGGGALYCAADKLDAALGGD